jgi:D-alanyl-D-alanine carboxypeptidase/D-alanyl-D-alanine-endopeptidase (penicillin-binding protein 4)
VWTASGCATNYRLTKSLADNFREGALFEKSHTGLVVYDPGAEKYLVEIKADHLFTPASNTKLWTVFAALQILGDSMPSLVYCTHGGHAYIRGMGDPTFLHQAYLHQPAFERLKHMADTLYYTPWDSSIPRYGPGWAWDDYPYYFQTERSLMPIYGNVVHVRKRHASTLDIIPGSLAGAISLGRDTLSQTPKITREERKNRFTVCPGQNLWAENIEIPFLTSDSLAATLLSDTLGIPVLVVRDSPKCTHWHKLYNASTSTLYRDILKDSDNFLAEQLLINCALTLSDTADTKIVTERILKYFFPQYAEIVHWVDGSGLSRYNQFTPRSMIEILLMLYQTVPEQRLYTMFPAGGVDGTIKNSFSGSEPYVFAKTGSMRHVYNLSGFLKTDGGKVLIFSFMNNHLDRPLAQVKTEMAEILEAIKKYYR